MEDDLIHQSSKKVKGYDNNVKAIISAMLGALSLITLMIIVYIAMIIGFFGLLFGIFALIEMRQSGQYGKGMAVTGIICSLITISLPLLVILIAILFL